MTLRLTILIHVIQGLDLSKLLGFFRYVQLLEFKKDTIEGEGINMKTHNFLDQFYTYDAETGKYIIEIALNDYDDIFNSWDSSVYNIRDLDSSLKSFLEECSADIAKSKDIILRFNIKNQIKDMEREKKIEQGIRNYFNYCKYITKNQFSFRRKRSFFYILASLFFTIVSYFLQNIVDNEFVKEIVLLGLTVGGWVFLWEAFSLLFIQSIDLSKKKKQYKRILAAPIKFKYD
ncbi:hypothetical protein [Aquibacillus rhizosphaerae]|uniref:DUF2812 domain-containing protein n=1 Tax=Aquibacillus rhizosphaerae TaxID=3051431 RepID=A0ABT7LB65_9BACI|nr:hypothetical protein [Aquibacillus sp. LR5S19]MDL4843098.1 hypothetical protein [Aquibacillus sp. LR5S19]